MIAKKNYARIIESLYVLHDHLLILAEILDLFKRLKHSRIIVRVRTASRAVCGGT